MYGTVSLVAGQAFSLFACFPQLLTDDDSNISGRVKLTVDQFEEIISLYSIKSQAEPGDAVGILAAQVSVSICLRILTSKCVQCPSSSNIIYTLCQLPYLANG